MSEEKTAGRGSGRGEFGDDLARVLAAYAAPRPSRESTEALIGKARATLSGDPGTFREAMERARGWSTGQDRFEPARRRALWAAILRQSARPAGAFSAVFWAVSLIVIAAGAVYLAFDGQSAVLTFSFIAPTVAAMGVAYALRSFGSGAWEMEMSSTMSPVELALGRVVIVAGADVVLGVAGSVLASWGRPPLYVSQLVLTWLAPVLLLSALAFYVSVRFGAPAAAGGSVGVWGALVAARAWNLSVSPFRLPGDGQWATVQVAGLLLAALLVWRSVGRASALRDNLRPGAGAL